MYWLTKAAARICSALIALGVSVLAGATLSVVIVERRLSALPDMLVNLRWFSLGGPLPRQTTVSNSLVEAEWWFAFTIANYIATISSILWIILSYLSKPGRRSAAILGFSLCSLMAGLVFYWLDTPAAIQNTALIGMLGAGISQITFGIDHVLGKRIHS